MNKKVSKLLAALGFFAALAGASIAQAGTVVADWQFSGAAGTTLNDSPNTGAGAGSNWGLNLTGSSSNGSGQFRIANDGKGGATGTRSAYADLLPDLGEFSSGTLSLFTQFAAWNPAGSQTNAPSFTLGFIEGNYFSSAQFTLSALASGFGLRGEVDAYGGGANLAQTWQSSGAFQPLTVRLDVNLDLLDYSLAVDSGSGYNWLGHAAIDPATLAINSLRLSVDGDFSANALLIERIWVESAPTSAVPEPSALWLGLLGLLILAAMSRRRAAYGTAGR